MSSPYQAPDFYRKALDQGRHRAITGGYWDAAGDLQLRALIQAGLQPEHRLLDIGCGALRLGRKAVPYLRPAHYWGTDASGPLMQRGRQVELDDPSRLPPGQLIEDAEFALPDIPETIDFAIAYAVFTHLPAASLDACLHSLRRRCPQLRAFLFTVALGDSASPVRQQGGVVTHSDRPPFHRQLAAVQAQVAAAGYGLWQSPLWLPRSQVLFFARPDSIRPMVGADL